MKQWIVHINIVTIVTETLEATCSYKALNNECHGQTEQSDNICDSVELKHQIKGNVASLFLKMQA